MIPRRVHPPRERLGAGERPGLGQDLRLEPRHDLPGRERLGHFGGESGFGSGGDRGRLGPEADRAGPVGQGLGQRLLGREQTASPEPWRRSGRAMPIEALR
jgi:hypothetical protein